MTTPWAFRSPLANGIERFLAYKRVLGRRYDTEEKQLRLFDRFLVQQTLTSLAQITPDLLNTFLAARPRRRPRSYNQLVGVLRRLFDWLVSQELLPRSPLKALPRRETAQRIPYVFDAAHARRLLEVAGRLPDGPGLGSGARRTGRSSRCSMASGCASERSRASGAPMSTWSGIC